MSSFASTLRRILSNRNVAVLTVADVAFILGTSLWWTFQPLYVLALGASKEILGMLFVLQASTILVFQIPGGVLADRLGRRKLVLSGAVIRCIPPLIYLLANHWVYFILGAIINGVTAIDIAPWHALLVESLPPESRGAGYSIYRAITSLPGLFMPPLGGILIDSMGVIQGTRVCLMINEATMVAYTLILWRYLRETRSRRDLERREDSGRDNETLVQRLDAVPRSVWVLILVGGISSFATRLSASFMVVYADEVVGLSKRDYGILATIVSLMSISLTTPAGFLGDRVGRKPCVLISQGLSTLSTFLFISSREFGAIVFSRVVEGVASGFGGLAAGEMGGANWQALIADVVPPERRGSIIGLIGAVVGALGAPSPWIGGHLYQNFSPTLPFQLNIVLRAAAMVAFILLLKEPERKKG